MKRISKVLLVLTSCLISNLVFAAKDTTMNITVINMTPNTGNIFYSDLNGDMTKGAIVERNGGSVQIKQTFNDYLQLTGLQLVTNWGFYCSQNGEGNVVLNPTLYKGDNITITFTGFNSDGWLECTCSGSACDLSMTKIKKPNKEMH